MAFSLRRWRGHAGMPAMHVPRGEELGIQQHVFASLDRCALDAMHLKRDEIGAVEETRALLASWTLRSSTRPPTLGHRPGATYRHCRRWKQWKLVALRVPRVARLDRPRRCLVYVDAGAVGVVRYELDHGDHAVFQVNFGDGAELAVDELC